MDFDSDWTEAWTRRQIRSLFGWQYGVGFAEALANGAIGVRSRRTGRLRQIRYGERPGFVVGDDGLPRPTFVGAGRLHELLPPGSHRVVLEAEAAEFARRGRSVFSKFVRAADPALVPGSSCLLVDPEGALVGVGRLLLAPHEMRRLARGVAVLLTSHPKAPEVLDEDEPGEGAVFARDEP